MKRRCTTMLLTLIFIVNLTACVDFNAGKRPVDQKNTRWRSADPDIYFDVSAKYGEITGGSPYGKINIDGVVTEIAVDFDFGSRVQFRPAFAFTDSGGIDGDAVFFQGDCDFSEDKLVVRNIRNNPYGTYDENLLCDSIKTITFYREEIK